MVKLVLKEAVNLGDNSGLAIDLDPPKFLWKVSVSSSSSSSSRVITSDDWTRASKNHKKHGVCDVQFHTSNDKDVIDLGDDMDATVTLKLKRKRMVKKSVGMTSFTVGELVQMCHNKEEGTVELMLFDKSTENLVAAGPYGGHPSIVRVGVEKSEDTSSGGGGGGDSSSKVGELVQMCHNKEEETVELMLEKNKDEPCKKRVMIITRGTRGDVQPFLALARGLADLQYCEVIFVTELEFKASILKNSMSPNENGSISFRPSGGNTMKKVNQALSQFAINYKVTAPQTNAMQSLFLSRTEVEFFSSEPALHYWAECLKPDLLIYGFTTASMAMIVSESLKIPLVGFFLQPTCIPSNQYPPCLPLKEKNYRKLTQSTIVKKHEASVFLKSLMDNVTVGGDSMASMRRRRGLKHYNFKTNVYQELKNKNYPIIVPVNETLFGGKPEDWSEKAVFTDCIFLRGKKVEPIAPDALAFLDGAKAMNGGKVVILAFSSMPVTKAQIVSIALKLIHECSEPKKVCVFALIGNGLDLPLSSKKLEVDCQKARDDGRLFLASRAPFGRLFPLVDAIVMHGGLGTTSETIQAQIPAIVTGVLLLDQRFWGMRCCELGVGPFGSHIDDFPKHCVEYVDKALQDGSEWKQNAEKIGSLIAEEAKEDSSGVQRNVDCVIKMAKDAKPYWYCPDEAFSAYDNDKDGELTLDEITEMVHSLNLSLDEAEIKNIFERGDKDNSGTLDRFEFTRGSVYQAFMGAMEKE